MLGAIAMVVIPLVPRPLIVATARGLGWIGVTCSGRLRRIGLANLEVAFGDALSHDERIRILRHSFQSLTLVMLDIFWFALFARRRIERLVEIDESLMRLSGREPAVVVSAHLGNWEIFGKAAAMANDGPLLSVVAPLKNPAVGRLLNWTRRGTGMRVVDKQGAVKDLLRTLRGAGKIALLLDQNTLESDGGVFVDMFGLPVPISNAAGALANRAKAPIVFAWCVSDRKGRYHGACHPIWTPGETVSHEEITQRIAHALEQTVRKHPENWTWMYKRWKYIPETHTKADYPFYARRVDE